MQVLNAFEVFFVLLLSLGYETEAASLDALKLKEGDVHSNNLMATLKGTGNSANVLLMKGSHDSCPNARLSNIVNQAIQLYPSNSQFMAQQIYNSISISDTGGDNNWVVQVAAVTTSSQWSYWGSSNVFTSQYYCLIVTDKWFVSVVRVNVS